MKKFTTVISFRTTAEEKKAFQEACDRFTTIPSKYASGNALRRFINCYCQNPRWFENIFNNYSK